jgi:hypothetical protein
MDGRVELMDLEVWKQHYDEMMREAEQNRLANELRTARKKRAKSMKRWRALWCPIIRDLEPPSDGRHEATVIDQNPQPRDLYVRLATGFRLPRAGFSAGRPRSRASGQMSGDRRDRAAGSPVEHPGWLMDLNMLGITGGRERTAQDGGSSAWVPPVRR